MGISHFTTPPHTPEQNGIAERRHRHIVETGLALPALCWSTTHILVSCLSNGGLSYQSPTHTDFPYHILHRTTPNYTKLKTFGCLCYPWLKPYVTSKLQPNNNRVYFLVTIWTNPLTNALILQHIDSIILAMSHLLRMNFLPKGSFPPLPPMMHSLNPSLFPLHPILLPHHILPSRHLLPNPHLINSINALHRLMHPLPLLTPSSNNLSHRPLLLTPLPPPPALTPLSPTNLFHLSQQSRHPLPLHPSLPCLLETGSQILNTTILSLLIPPLFIPFRTLEPTAHLQTSKDPLWRKAMDDEYNALLRNQTWELVAPTSRPPTGCKWIFRVQRHPDGSIAKYKARLVAKGFLQEYGKDYFDTFSPVTTGPLQYFAFTCPVISFAVNKLSQFMHQPTQTHWQALKHLLRYLKGTIYHGFFLRKNSPLELNAFSDSNWRVSSAGRSTTAYVIYLDGNIISWKFARQKSVSCSSTEAVYKALANAAAELAWVENILKELGISIRVSPLLYCNNTGATSLCANPVYHSRMKHVVLDYHFVRERMSVLFEIIISTLKIN
ncbi:hypothetical protein OSB04_010558 [Centaurea solstitialis]|uniref:Reverse transcriptase Ty1/copia-type domain-containing protein n=1 Tax=Centaurea solstitialis TaxID=347529 RepID=A0AA38T7U7_9ASTR|nr:hypothetical protein OSB04_010558 [Centaurea solstitialis]